MKKLMSVLLALALVLSLNVAAMAAVTLGTDTSSDTNVKNPAYDVAISDGFTPIDSVIFKSTLTSQGDYNSVGAKFTYTITSGDTSSVGTAPNKVYQIYAGPVAAIKNTTLTATHAINASTSKSAVSVQNVTIEFQNVNTINFPQSGIYRYKVTQSALTAAQVAASIKALKDATDSAGVTDAVDKYLDVYVITNDTNGDGAADTSKIYGVVLFESVNDPTSVDTTKLEDTGKVYANYATTNAQKTDSFDNIYNAYKITLEKKVSGAAASASDKFPFSLTITDPDTGNSDDSVTLTGVTYTIAASSAASTATSTANIGDTVTSIKLKKDETIEITGLSASAVVKVKETISALLGYSITSAIANFDPETSNITTAVTSDTEGTSGVVKAVDTGKITYTNVREQISPTGVILRIAPYALILVAGIALLLISHHKKASEEAE